MGVNLCLKLETLIKLADKLDLHPSVTVIIGDISHTGTEHNYNLAKRYITKIQSLGSPAVHIMGHMDNRKNFSNILFEDLSPQDKHTCYYSQTIEEIHVSARTM